MAGYPGKQGPKHKPTAVKRLQGTYRPDRANPREPSIQALETLPRCPAHLIGEARRTWGTMGRQLINMGILSHADLPALEAYCTIYARWKDAQAKLDEFGVVMKGPDGWFKQSPYLAIVDNCLKHMRSFMGEFGITPSSRGRVSTIQDAVKEVDPFEELLSGDRRN